MIQVSAGFCLCNTNVFSQAKYVGSRHNISGHFHKGVSYADMQLAARQELESRRLQRFDIELCEEFRSMVCYVHFILGITLVTLSFHSTLSLVSVSN